MQMLSCPASVSGASDFPKPEPRSRRMWCGCASRRLANDLFQPGLGLGFGILMLIGCLMGPVAHAAPGDVDLTFQPDGFTADGFQALAMTPADRVLVGGYFSGTKSVGGGSRGGGLF